MNDNSCFDAILKDGNASHYKLKHLLLKVLWCVVTPDEMEKRKDTVNTVPTSAIVRDRDFFKKRFVGFVKVQLC
ncbi:hypothetical protein Tco_0701526 [Tanacetum coccineum]